MASSSASASSGNHTQEKLGSWGCSGFLTAAQNADLQQFLSAANQVDLEVAKFRVESLESVSLRFLRARDFSVTKALTLLGECVKRKQSEVVEQYSSLTANQAANCDVEILKKWYPHSQLGFDKLNRPILFEHSGGVNSGVLLQLTTLENLIRYHWWTMENELNRMFDAAAARGDVVISTCVILDFSGMTLSHFSSQALDQLKAIVSIDNTCYPELLGKMLIINAPWIASSMWEALKGWLDPRTQAKVEFVRSGPDTARKLLEFIEPAQLPKAYGGLGASSYTCKEQAELLHVPRAGHMTRAVTVPAGHKVELDCYLGEGEVVLEVTLTVSSRNAISLKKVTMKKPDPHSLHPFRLLLPFQNNESSPATYTATWTNTATFYSRQVMFAFTVIEPEQELAAALSDLNVKSDNPNPNPNISEPTASTNTVPLGDSEKTSAEDETVDEDSASFLASDDECEDVEPTQSKSPPTAIQPKENDEEAEFTEGDSDSGQACVGDDIRNCMHVYSASPPLIGGRERKKLPKGAPLPDTSGDEKWLVDRRKRKSAVAAQQKFKELFKNSGDTSEDEGRKAEEHQPTAFPSPRRKANSKAKPRDFTVLTTAETGDSKRSSRSSGRRRIIAEDEDEDEDESNGEEEWQEEEDLEDDEENDEEEEEEKKKDKTREEQPRRVSRRQKQSARSEAALHELKKRRGQSSLQHVELSSGDEGGVEGDDDDEGDIEEDEEEDAAPPTPPIRKRRQPSESFFRNAFGSRRQSYDREDEPDAEAESDLDDFIVHSSEEERQAESARQQRRAEKQQRKQQREERRKKKKKSKGEAEPAEEKGQKADRLLPASKKSKPSRRIVVDSEEEFDGDAKEEERGKGRDDDDDEEDEAEDGEESDEESEGSEEDEEEDENLLYLKVNAMHEEEADFSAVSALTGRRSFTQPEALRLYILLLGFCLVDETYLESVRKYPNREPHSSYLGASRQIENLICTSRESLLGSSAWKAEFLEQLSSRPFYTVSGVSSGPWMSGGRCMACGRSSQRPDHKVYLFGSSYESKRCWESDRWDTLLPEALYLDLVTIPEEKPKVEKGVAKQSVTKKRPRRVIVLSDDEEDLNADEEDASEDHMGEDEVEPSSRQATPWWKKRWPQRLVSEEESTWELAAHCRSRTQLYHTLLHYKFRLMLKIRERIERECMDIVRQKANSSSGCKEDLHDLIMRLGDDRKFLQIEVTRFETLLRNATVKWGSSKEELAAADNDLWADQEFVHLSQSRSSSKGSSLPSASSNSITSWLLKSDGNRPKKHKP